jgi:hypothetical protein
MRVRLYQMYGRLRCDNVRSNVFMQDSIGIASNPCHPKNKGCSNVVQLQDKTATSEFVYTLIPANINFGQMTAYVLPLSVQADSTGWPSRSFLLYAIIEVREQILLRCRRQRRLPPSQQSSLTRPELQRVA